ncbi:MAG: hypothetical protein Q7T78_21755 [Rhodoferax sp.]|nr:hypothetical protein [Rhodoferax sp.]
MRPLLTTSIPDGSASGAASSPEGSGLADRLSASCQRGERLLVAGCCPMRSVQSAALQLRGAPAGRTRAEAIGPQLHLIGFHEVLATNAKLRPLVVPQGPPAEAQEAAEGAATAECEVEPVQAGSHRIGCPR